MSQVSDHGAASRPFAFYVDDPRVTLLPIEHLTPAGVTSAFTAFLLDECGWSSARVALFDRAFALYWQRSAELAARTRTWPAPRLRHVAVVHAADGVRPYVQLLNTSAWTLYAGDLDPALSHPELVAFLLAHGDRMAITLEVTTAAVHTAAWWLERTNEECAAFVAAAEKSQRPDGDGFRAIAAALPWLRQLRHESLRPPARLIVAGRSEIHRPVPHTGLLVPQGIQDRPPALVESWKRIASRVVADYRSRWKPEGATLDGLLVWLAGAKPNLLVTSRNDAILWDPAAPDRVGALRQELRQASGAGLRDIQRDLELVAEKTERFLTALTQPDALPQPAAQPEQAGYAYLHHSRRLIAYNLRETGIERLEGPALPYARPMLGARTIHEWCHLAVDAGWVPVTSEARLRDAMRAAAELLAATVRDTPLAIRSGAEIVPGETLVAGLLPRFADYRANVLAQRFLSLAERETYVRHNIRTLRGQVAPPQVFRTLARYLYEYQYLSFSIVENRREFFLRSTWFDDDYLRTRILDDARFDALAAAFAGIGAAYAVDESYFSRSQPD